MHGYQDMVIFVLTTQEIEAYKLIVSPLAHVCGDNDEVWHATQCDDHY